MGAGLASARDAGLDKDEFDNICEHLIITDSDNNNIVGTYRMLLDSVAKKNFGFYSEKEFDLRNIKQLEGKLLEVGRSCVHKNYRRKRVLDMLWSGLAEYAIDNEVRYIFGCVSIFTMDPKVVSMYYSLLKQMNHFLD